MTGSGLCRGPRRPPALLLLALASLLVAHTGCVTSKKYRLAKENTPPAKILNWSSAAPPVELTLQTLIIFKGPGSWKREARWDEYVVQLTNQGDQSATIESAVLTDLQGNPQFPGHEPWALEKQSYTNWDKYGKTGIKLVLGAGAILALAATEEAVAVAIIMSGGAAGGAAVLNVIPVIAVVDITAVAIMNHNNKAKVRQEFDRRRLTLPRPLPAGSHASGSFFFPITPGPRQLTLRGKSGGAPFELVLQLKPLADLHLNPVAVK